VPSARPERHNNKLPRLKQRRQMLLLVTPLQAQ
jgi:hypothetical protein